MSLNDDDDELSGSDSDDGFQEDMEALKRACLLSGTDFNDLQLTSSAAAAADVGVSGDGDVDGDGDGDGDITGSTDLIPSCADDDDLEDDMELVRSIRERFAITTGLLEPLSLRPLSSLPPTGLPEEEDDDSDFETLRAIQRRFAAYDDDSLKGISKKSLDKSEQVGATNITLEKETSNNLFVESTNAEEGFPTCVDGNEGCGNVITRSQPGDLIQWNECNDENPATVSVHSSGFPKSAQAFVDAIKKNRSCQKFIRSKLIQIEARAEELKKLKERVKILKDFQVTCRKRMGRALSQKKDARVQLISLPKQRVSLKLHGKKFAAIHYGPHENSQVSNYREALKQFSLSVSREEWSEVEREKLAKGVKQQFQEMLLQRSVDLLSEEDECSRDSRDLDSLIASIRDFKITPENMRQFLPKVNWDQVASMYLPGRCGAECQSRWLNWEDPLIKHGSWDTLEEKNLLHAVQQKGISNWIEIAASVGSCRTPFQCLSHYQRSLNASIIRREWTEEEDIKLCAAVETFGESNWQLVASTMEGRTGSQCSNRWIKSLHPSRKRCGKWTADEDKRLKVAVMLFHPKTWRNMVKSVPGRTPIWKKLAQYVPGRTHVQCRERWVNCLDPSLKLDEWTEEEDLKLTSAITEHGYSWSKVAACVPPRTDNQCRRRWKILLPDEVSMLQEAKKLRREVFISNFVDRELERPALRPDDLVPLQTHSSRTLPDVTTVKPKRRQRQRRGIAAKDAYSEHHEICDREKEPSEDGGGSNIPKDSSLSFTNQDVLRIPFGDEGGERDPALKNKRPSKRPLKKSKTSAPDVEVPEASAFNKVENATVDGKIRKNKRKTTLPVKRKSSSVASKESSSSLPNPTSAGMDARKTKNAADKPRSISDFTNQDMLRTTFGDEGGELDPAMKNKRRSKLPPKKSKASAPDVEVPDVEVPEASAFNKLENATVDGKIRKNKRKTSLPVKKKSSVARKESSSSGTGVGENPRPNSCHRQHESVTKDGGSDDLLESEDDNMTLASFILKSNGKKRRLSTAEVV